MINNCTYNDIDIIIKLGKNFNYDFEKLNNIEKLINNKSILGYYLNNKLLGILIFEQIYETIDIQY